MLPFLAGGQSEWDATIAELREKCQCITVDLPGFGEAAAYTGYSVSDMADSVMELLHFLQPRNYLLVGHSMSGKVCSVVVRRLLAGGDIPFRPPLGIVLVAPSPPGPEPMSESKRDEMLSMFDSSSNLDAYNDREQAHKYISDNLFCTIQHSIFKSLVNDVLKMNRNAWTAWLEEGSKEDWAQRVGVIELPSLLIAGMQDRSLGTEAQRTNTLPHFSACRLVSLDCSHLIPVEQPTALAFTISSFLDTLRVLPTEVGQESTQKGYAALIASQRVSPQTRTVLLERLLPPSSEYVPIALSSSMFLTLHALSARIVPQPSEDGRAAIDIAASIDQHLASGTGDGWRYATLPNDLESFRVGLSVLDELSLAMGVISFLDLTSDAQDSILGDISSGILRSSKLDLKLWFEDVRAETTRIFISHPSTLARIGYSGIADDPQGFVQLGIGRVENWEPQPE